MKSAIILLALLSLVSCGKKEARVIDPADITQGVLFAQADSTNKLTTIGYELRYICEKTDCLLSGELHQYSSGDNLSSYTIGYGEVKAKGNGIYVGKFCGTTVHCYNIKINTNVNKVIVDNETFCIETGIVSTQNEYDSFLGSKNVSNTGLGLHSKTECSL